MNFALTKNQDLMSVALSRVRHFCAVGGSRSTKTFGFVDNLVLRAIRAEGTDHAVLRFRGNAARASISLGTLPAVMRLHYPRVKYVEHRQDGFFELLKSGSRIWVGGLDDQDRVEKILGNEYLTMFFNECSQISYSSVLTALTRLAQNDPGGLIKQRAFYDLNPVGKGHWTNQVFGDKRDPRSRALLPNPEDYDRIFMNPKDNPHLSEAYKRELQNMPERQRKRFWDGVYVDEVEDALWPYDVIERCRVTRAEVPELRRIVVAVDPSGASDDEDGRDDIGIVVVGLGTDGVLYVLEDATMHGGPAKWGARAVKCFDDWEADCIVGETNYGGEMVQHVIHTVRRGVPFRKVTASRGKTVRAEPVSNLYAKDQVRHAGRFPQLEDQMAAWSTGGYTGSGSPNNVDAMVWGATELALKIGGGANLVEFFRRENEEEDTARMASAQQAAAPKGPTMQDVIEREALERAEREAQKAEPERPRKKSSFADQAEEQGKSGDPYRPPVQRAPVVTVTDNIVSTSYGPVRAEGKRRAA